MNLLYCVKNTRYCLTWNVGIKIWIVEYTDFGSNMHTGTYNSNTYYLELK